VVGAAGGLGLLIVGGSKKPEAKSIPPVTILPGDKPRDLMVTQTTNAAGGFNATISWRDPTNGRDPYVIEVERTDANSSKVTKTAYQVAAGKDNYTALGLIGTTEYCFIVVADVDGAKSVGTPASTCFGTP
jgi:hypothetical protein